MDIEKKLSRFPVPEFIWQEFYLDQQINDRGVKVDLNLAENAIKLDEIAKNELTSQIQLLTGIENPNSVMQMKEWLVSKGVHVDSLGKKDVEKLIPQVPEDVAEVLKLRQQLAKSSVKKYTAMQTAACKDHRARGMFSFYGAVRSGRFAGRLIQLQNLPQNHIPDLENARNAVMSGNYDVVKNKYKDVPDTLSQLIRTAFIPADGYKFIVADFSAIESRVLAWLAGKKWVLDTFNKGGDIYCATAEKMFHVPVKKHGINGDLRQKGKQATLSCGYGGSVGALKAMGALESGMKEDELKPLVDAWRAANPNIVSLWWDVGKCVIQAVRGRQRVKTHGIVFTYEAGFLFIQLPSGRRLAYPSPKIEINKFGSEEVTYLGLGVTKKWERISSYGPKFVENITQAIARDILLNSMKTLSDYKIVAHVHDELIIEAPESTEVDYICNLMGIAPKWAADLPLKADGYECVFYKKA